jgi:hypothetical protein
MKKILLTGMMLCLTASMALASGLNFTWATSDQCPTTPIANQTWDCVTMPGANDGSFFLVVSVMPNIAVVGFNALDFRIDGQSVGPVPAWWQMFNAGSCREASITPVVRNTGTFLAPCAGSATTKLWTTAAYGGMGAWTILGNRFNTVIGFATAANRTVNLSTTTQYNVCNLVLDTNNSAADPDNAIVECAGCAEGMTLVLNQITLNGSAAPDAVTQVGTTVGAQQCITWQGGSGAGVCAATPARNTTWGQVKSLYR